MDNCFISTAKLLAKSSLVAKDPNAQYVADALTDAIADSQYIKGDNLLKTRVVSFINNSIWGKDKFFLDWLNFKSGLVKDVISPDKILYYGDTQSGITAINTFKSWASRFAKYISQDINITATANFNKDIHYFGSKKAYDDLRIRVKKGNGERIKAHAVKMGESVNAFVTRAIEETIINDEKTADD